MRGVARSAKKSRKRFGGALEPLTYVRVYYEDRERQELARLDSCEVLESPLATEVGYPRAVALAQSPRCWMSCCPTARPMMRYSGLAFSVHRWTARSRNLDAHNVLRVLDDPADGLFCRSCPSAWFVAGL